MGFDLPGVECIGSAIKATTASLAAPTRGRSPKAAGEIRRWSSPAAYQEQFRAYCEDMARRRFEDKRIDVTVGVYLRELPT
jgi:hypothetical protein